MSNKIEVIIYLFNTPSLSADDPDGISEGSYDAQYYFDLLEEYMPERTPTDHGQTTAAVLTLVPCHSCWRCSICLPRLLEVAILESA